MKTKLLPILFVFTLLACSTENDPEDKRMQIITSRPYEKGQTYERRFELHDIETFYHGDFETIIVYSIRSECGQWQFMLYRDEDRKDMPPEKLVNEMNEYNDAHPNNKIQKHLIADFEFTLPDAESIGILEFKRMSEWRVVNGEYLPYELPDNGLILKYLRVTE